MEARRRQRQRERNGYRVTDGEGGTPVRDGERQEKESIRETGREVKGKGIDGRERLTGRMQERDREI